MVDETKHFFSAFIGEVAEAPLHLVDNEYIKRGYRIGYNRSVKSILRSFFQMHNESVNVWSHFFGMLFFASMIFYTFQNYSGFKDMGSFVQSGLEQAKSQNQHFISYFQTQLQEIEYDLGQLYHTSEGMGSPTEDNSTKRNFTFGDVQADHMWGARLQQAVHRIEGLALNFMSELSHFKNYIEEEEQVLEDKFHEWTAHVHHFPEELKKRIDLAQQLIQGQVTNGTSVF